MRAMILPAVRYVAILVLIPLALYAAYIFSGAQKYAEAASIARGAKDFKELSDRFVALADTKGAEYAFVVLKRVNLPPNTDLHLLGHVVGDELYKQRGVDGIGICTQDFRNACSHAIVIGALNEFGGEPALLLIRDACKKAPGGPGAYTMCYHGLGHGIFAFYGYDLEPTIALCKQTGTEEYHEREYIECVGGAVMELMGGGGHDRDAWLASRSRYLSEDAPLAPCTSDVIPSEIKPLCLVYLTPRLWELADIDLGRPDPTQFTKAFAFCDALPPSQKELRDACFGGFGKEFIPLAGARDIRSVDQLPDFVYALAIEWCAYAPAVDGRSACISEALSSVFWGGENDPNASFRFCGLVPESEMQSACYRSLARNIQSYAVTSERSALCARIPEEERKECTVLGI
ncbi:MAG: hypothetical protein Athens041674_535 [Parcubacteria group bacterium Athens0416_74]|nr:MAG: hypothetical protein Athens041674_535 [Parcubacteria group bacterium Athens0416_74]